MQIIDLNDLEQGQEIDADVLIVGGGPAGLTIAREFFGHSARVIVVESGRLQEDPQIEALNALESVGDPRSPAQIARRSTVHSANAHSWSHEVQPYGARCRVLGGSSQAWSGKSAAFDAIDFETRPWVPYSGWPIALGEIETHIDRAAEHLNLGPNVYDERLWKLIGREPDPPHLDPKLLKTFFWQFARSRIDPMDIMRFGPEFLRAEAGNVRVLVNATATRILTSESGTSVTGVQVANLQGAGARVRSRLVVLAASAIENPRLLLASDQIQPAGLGNENDVVGRYLLEHQGAQIGSFGKRDVQKINKRLGFQGVSHGGRTHLYMHGLVLPREVMEQEGLLNCALYVIEQHSPDDPLAAIKRLMRGKSPAPFADLLAVAKSPGFVAKAAGIKAFQSGMVPGWLERAIVNAAIRIDPNFTVREHFYRGMPHKVLGLKLEGISEQRPNPDSRITLSSTKDPLGVPRAKADWKLDGQARKSLARLAQLMSREFARVGLPQPALAEWVGNDEVEDTFSIDLAHMMGTTRMSEDPKRGVVDRDCGVHGVAGLYIAGGSVFPTGGHANPTLMILALAVRLSDHLKQVLPQHRARELAMSN